MNPGGDEGDGGVRTGTGYESGGVKAPAIGDVAASVEHGGIVQQRRERCTAERRIRDEIGRWPGYDGIRRRGGDDTERFSVTVLAVHHHIIGGSSGGRKGQRHRTACRGRSCRTLSDTGQRATGSREDFHRQSIGVADVIYGDSRCSRGGSRKGEPDVIGDGIIPAIKNVATTRCRTRSTAGDRTVGTQGQGSRTIVVLSVDTALDKEQGKEKGQNMGSHAAVFTGYEIRP